MEAAVVQAAVQAAVVEAAAVQAAVADPAKPGPPSEARRGRYSYQPLVPLCAALGAGLLVDRFLAPLPFLGWIGGAALAGALWLAAWRWTRRRAESPTRDYPGAALLLAATLCLGGAWHHLQWNLMRADDIARRASERPRPAALEGVLVEPARVRPPPPFDPLSTAPGETQSRFVLRVTAARDGDAWRPASGRVEVIVAGETKNARVGDRVRVFGLLALAPAPRNPGEFDQFAHARGERRVAQLRCDTADAARVVAPGGWFVPGRWLAALREGFSQGLHRHLTPERAPLAAALLLGEREQLAPERTQAFFHAGVVHLLAISGLHVGILTAGFFVAARLGWCRPRVAYMLAALFVVGYAWLTDANPPVTRAAVLVVVFCAAKAWGRPGQAVNTLAAAALVVLALNPSDLTLAGAQLSFLAVLVLATRSAWRSPAPPDPLEEHIRATRPWPQRCLRQAGAFVGEMFVTSALVWLLTTPLVLYRFHLATPVALALNPLTWPPLVVAMFSGFGVMLAAAWAPPLASLLGGLCDLSLWALEGLVDAALLPPGGRFYTSGPSLPWVLVFYAALFVALALPAAWRPPRRWLLAALGLWLALGLPALPGAGRPARDPSTLACTFLSVGHGLCAVLELPDGRVVLYDAGKLGHPSPATRVAAGFLWSQGVQRLDAAIVSHADADHYNALPGVLERFPTRVACVGPNMFAKPNASLRALESTLAGSGAETRVLARGDVLRFGPDTWARVLHPPPDGAAGSDNANSLVLLIEHAGRRLLLTGDVESPGLDALLSQPPMDCDVVLAPHHGSARSQPAGFLRWCQPEHVVISGDLHPGETADAVKSRFAAPGARCHHTAVDGAVRVELSAAGARVFTWRAPRAR